MGRSGEWPFVYQNYNVQVFFKSSLRPDPCVAKVLNSLMEGLNSTPKLPKYIFVVPDSDVIEDTAYYDFGVMLLLEEQLDWLFAQMEKYVTRRRDNLKEKRADSILMSTHEPRFIWIAMIDRPFTTDYKLKRILDLKNRFNELHHSHVEHEKYTT